MLVRVGRLVELDDSGFAERSLSVGPSGLCCVGVDPNAADICRPLANCPPLPTAATSAVAMIWRARHFPWRHVLSYIVVQIATAFLGVAPAQIMFSLPLLPQPPNRRAAADHWARAAQGRGLGRQPA